MKSPVIAFLSALLGAPLAGVGVISFLDARIDERVKVSPVLADLKRPAPVLPTAEDVRKDQLIRWNSDKKTSGFPPHNYNMQTQRAECPPEYFASGIEIKYGGTCEGKCNEDGGTVQGSHGRVGRCEQAPPNTAYRPERANWES